MNSYISSILLGVTLAAPLGPVGTEVIKRSFRQGFWSAYIVALGSVFGDAACLLVSYLGLTHVLQLPVAKVCIWSVGSLMLLYLAWSNLKTVLRPDSLFETSKTRNTNAFLLGFLLAIANPLSMAFWFGIFGAMMGETVESSGYSFLSFLPHTGILIGVILWFSFLCISLGLFRRILSARFESLRYRFSQIISAFAFTILAYFGISFAIKAIVGFIDLF
jgi:L-lysine exporter family protein LysE/ArgO